MYPGENSPPELGRDTGPGPGDPPRSDTGQGEIVQDVTEATGMNSLHLPGGMSIIRKNDIPEFLVQNEEGLHHLPIRTGKADPGNSLQFFPGCRGWSDELPLAAQEVMPGEGELIE